MHFCLGALWVEANVVTQVIVDYDPLKTVEKLNAPIVTQDIFEHYQMTKVKNIYLL